MKHPNGATALLFLAATISFACAKPDNNNETPVQDSTAATPAPTPAVAGPTDAQIAHIVVTANTIDIDAGKNTKGKATNADVKSFAAMMIEQHTASNGQATALVKKLNVTPEDNSTSQALKAGAEQALVAVNGKAGADFDKAYIDNEVNYHQSVLDAIDKTLIPSAQNAELKSLLEQTRPVIAGHLERAKQVQAGLNK